jgi:hypothetical protein
LATGMVLDPSWTQDHHFVASMPFDKVPMTSAAVVSAFRVRLA